jgi:ATP-binding cassette subfamily B protein
LRDLQQVESVRHFLTGRLFQTMLDTCALPLLLIGLSIYSAKLTAVVLGFSLLITAVIAVMVPIFRRELERLYQAEGARQADLVETLHGMRAIKSLALDQVRKTSWDIKIAASVERRASVGRLGTLGSAITGWLEKMMQIGILSLGAKEVFDGNLSIGALIAFNMLSGRVTGPLLQIVGLVNEYQQTALSVKMLGKIMDHAPERDPNQRGTRPTIAGRLEFQGVRFRYDGSSSPALNNVTFSVDEGQMIGVVGRSGSGKTTLTRLIQGIHTSQEGQVRLDGCDLRHIDLTHLRRAIGVVLQDNFLFRGTIFENIAASRADATLDEVMEAARMAGANEFIDRLPRSYATPVEENASNFSGGQKQRIAIARALLSKPRLLLFDEATSALDPESEAIVQQNLNEIARGRTMIVVSHRLSTLVPADAILVLERGEVADFAPHSILLERCSIYRHLWDQQTRHMQ